MLDFTRDGIPLSQAFEVVAKRADVSVGGTDIAIDSFVSVPYWQFFLRVSSQRAVRLAPRDIELVDDGTRVAAARDVTSSLRRIGAGASAEGIVTFPAQATADGLTLRMSFQVPGAPGRSISSSRI